MVNNCTNINNMNNQLSPQITEHKMTMTYDIGNPVPGLGKTQTCGKIKFVIDVLHHFYHYFNYVVVI